MDDAADNGSSDIMAKHAPIGLRAKPMAEAMQWHVVAVVFDMQTEVGAGLPQIWSHRPSHEQRTLH